MTTLLNALAHWTTLNGRDPTHLYHLDNGAAFYLADNVDAWFQEDPLICLTLVAARPILARQRTVLDAREAPLLWLVHSPMPSRVFSWVRAVLVQTDGVEAIVLPFEQWLPGNGTLHVASNPLLSSLSSDLSLRVMALLRHIEVALDAAGMEPLTLMEASPMLALRLRILSPQHIDLLQWTTLLDTDDLDDLHEAANATLPLLECLQKWASLASIRLTWSNDSNVYGRFSPSLLDERLFEPWDNAEEALAFETTLDARRVMRTLPLPPLVIPPLLPLLPPSRPSLQPNARQSLLEDTLLANGHHALEALVKVPLVPRLISRKLPTPILGDEAWLTLVHIPTPAPHLPPLHADCTHALLVVSLEHAPGLHREGQPALALELDANAAATFDIFRRAAVILARPPARTALVLTHLTVQALGRIDMALWPLGDTPVRFYQVRV